MPETLIGGNPEFYLNSLLGIGRLKPQAITPEAFAEYLRCFRDLATIHATCEDYRAAATIDLIHDEADMERKITCPVLALWGEKGFLHKNYDVPAVWRERAVNVAGKSLPCGHFLAEEAPEETLTALRTFLAGN
jgi:haloacetate dehalogenase